MVVNEAALQAMSGIISNSGETMSGQCIMRVSVDTAEILNPTESEIATVAYGLWLNRGCPVGSDQEDWFRATEMLMRGTFTRGRDFPRPFSAFRRALHARSRTVGEFRWDGHWEAWESEWGGARWIWD